MTERDVGALLTICGRNATLSNIRPSARIGWEDGDLKYYGVLLLPVSFLSEDGVIVEWEVLGE